MQMFMGFYFIFFIMIVISLSLFLVATIISIVFCCGRKKRKLTGKKLGSQKLIPIILYIFSAPTLLILLGLIIWRISMPLDYYQYTSAIVNHEPKQFETLMEKEFVFDVTKEMGKENLVILAIEYNEPESLTLLLEQGVDVNQLILTTGSVRFPESTLKKEYPIHYALDFLNSDYTIIKILLDYGADPNQIDEDGNTALHLIPYGEEKSIPIAKLLLKYGADKTIKNNKGLTAYEDYQKVEKDNNGDKSNEDRNLIYKEMDAILNK